MNRAAQVTYFLLRVVTCWLFFQFGSMILFRWFGGMPSGQPTLLSFDAWRALIWGTNAILDPSISGAGADPDGMFGDQRGDGGGQLYGTRAGTPGAGVDLQVAGWLAGLRHAEKFRAGTAAHYAAKFTAETQRTQRRHGGEWSRG